MNYKRFNVNKINETDARIKSRCLEELTIKIFVFINEKQYFFFVLQNNDVNSK